MNVRELHSERNSIWRHKYHSGSIVYMDIRIGLNKKETNIFFSTNM